MELSAQECAERSAKNMWANDAATKWFGMSLEEIAPGSAVMKLTVKQHHTNGHGTCHGGVIFSLADSAFAFACNSYNGVAVAQHNMISFIMPGRLDNVLTATAREVSVKGRSGIYDVQVTRGDGQVIAEMRGCSRTIQGMHFE